MPEEDEISEDSRFLVRLAELLESGDAAAAAGFLDSPESQSAAQRTLWDLVPLLIHRLDEPRIGEACETLLFTLTRIGNPRELLILLRESPYEGKMRRLRLPLLLTTLIRCGSAKALAWFPEEMRFHLARLPQLTNEKPASEASNEPDEAEELLVSDLEATRTFLESLQDLKEESCNKKLLVLYLFLFGEPFCHLRLRLTGVKSMYEAILSQMGRLMGNLLRFHKTIDARSHRRRKLGPSSSATSEEEQEEDKEDEEDEGKDESQGEEEVPDLAYANFYYFLLSEDRDLPLVYNPHYLLPGLLHLSTCLLSQSDYVCSAKGVSLAAAALRNIEPLSIGHEVLETPVYHDICARLSYVMIYCDADETRAAALRVFRDYVDRFGMRGRYLLLLSLYETSSHSGFRALLTSIAKASIIRCLDRPADRFFFDARLARLLKRICRLPRGDGSDLVEISDEVVAALNLLRFLVIRDREDATGVWGIVERLEREYLAPLREAVGKAREFWTTRMRANENRGAETPAAEFSVSVAGENLPGMSAADETEACLRAMNALDVIESIAVRVNECVEENRPTKLAEKD